MAAQAIPGDHSGFLAQIADSARKAEDGVASRVDDVYITVDGSILTLNWATAPEATSYKVYSSDSPELGFTEDNSGSFDGLTWTTAISAASRFYYVTSVGFEVPGGFVYVPGGTFTMGDTRGVGYGNELPTHNVTLSPFYIGQYEVTQSEWVAVMGSNPASGYGVGDNYPVYYVSWYSSLKYCNLRSMAEGLSPCFTINGSTDPVDWGSVPTSSNDIWNAAICNWNANGYRLPTEAEWEYAARGATNTPDYLHAGSDDINAVAWYAGNASPFMTKPVGTKAPNGIATYDMSGNVWEWCWDWYGSSYYSSSPSNNPTGPSSGSSRLFRGGHFSAVPDNCRVSIRGQVYPYGCSVSGGLRLCRTQN